MVVPYCTECRRLIMSSVLVVFVVVALVIRIINCVRVHYRSPESVQQAA